MRATYHTYLTPLGFDDYEDDIIEVAIKIMKLTNTLISALFCYFHLLR
jgi:hypothetical protein